MSMDLGKHANVMLLLCHLLLLLLLKADSKCLKSYRCRNFTLEFPFTVSSDPDCGLFTVDGCDSANRPPTLHTRDNATSLQILRKTSTNSFLVRDSLLHEELALPTCISFSNLDPPYSPFVSLTFSPNLTFFTCYNQTPYDYYFPSYRSFSCKASTVYYRNPSTHQDHALPIPQGCLQTQLPIKSSNSSADLLHLLSADFTLEWNVSQNCTQCYHEGGQCFSDNQQQFYCGKGNFFADCNIRLKDHVYYYASTDTSCLCCHLF